MDKKTEQFAIFCNIRLEVLDKLEKATKDKNKNDIIKYKQQLEYVELKIKELQAK